MKPENFENALNELPTGDDIYNCTCKSCVDGSIKRMTRAPVTDAQREALPDQHRNVDKCENVQQLAGLLSTQDFTDHHPIHAFEWVLKMQQWFSRAALTSPAQAQVDVEKLAKDVLLIGEGLATCASIREATGLPVIVAFDAGNLKPVAETIRAESDKAPD